MSHSLHPSSARSDMDEIETLARAAVLPAARPASPPRASIPVSSSSGPPALPPAAAKLPFSAAAPASASASVSGSISVPIASGGFGREAANTLTEPVWDTVRRDLQRVVTNLQLVVFPNPFREDPGKALRDWDLWGPFFFIVSLGLILSWSATDAKVITVTAPKVQHAKSSVSSFCSCLCCISCWCYSSHAQCSTAGWAYHLLPKPQSSWILPVPFGCWGSDLHAEGQCHAKDSRGDGNTGMELLGSISVHECCC